MIVSNNQTKQYKNNITKIVIYCINISHQVRKSTLCVSEIMTIWHCRNLIISSRSRINNRWQLTRHISFELWHAAGHPERLPEIPLCVSLHPVRNNHITIIEECDNFCGTSYWTVPHKNAPYAIWWPTGKHTLYKPLLSAVTKISGF